MQKLRVIEGNKKTIDYASIYLKLFNEELNVYDVENKNNLKRLSYYGVKAINEMLKKQEEFEYERLLALFEFLEIVKIAMSLLTPNQLITVFPVDKEYDGDKYKVKDYFYTMEKLKNIGMDNMIMGQIEHLLWDYENKDIRRFLVNDLSILSDINKIETGEGIAERWARENNINTYSLYEDKTTNKKYLYDQKGNRFVVKNKIPKYLKVIEGGDLKCNG